MRWFRLGLRSGNDQTNSCGRFCNFNGDRAAAIVPFKAREFGGRGGFQTFPLGAQCRFVLLDEIGEYDLFAAIPFAGVAQLRLLIDPAPVCIRKGILHLPVSVATGTMLDALRHDGPKAFAAGGHQQGENDIQWKRVVFLACNLVSMMFHIFS